MLFHLPADTECELTTFVGRTQKSGPDDVPAVSFRLLLSSVSNELLDLFSPTIRLTAYEPVPGQEDLPGVSPTTPILRSKDLKHWAPETRLEGWKLIVARGITDEGALQMGTCKLDDFKFDFFDGGHVDCDFRVSTADVDEAGAGMLWGRQKRKVFVTIIAPEVPPKGDTAAVIDGSVEAFKRDHPDLVDQAGDGEPGEDDGPEGEDDDDDQDGPTLAADDPPKPKRGRKAKPDATEEFIARNQAAGAH